MNKEFKELKDTMLNKTIQKVEIGLFDQTGEQMVVSEVLKITYTDGTSTTIAAQDTSGRGDSSCCIEGIYDPEEFINHNDGVWLEPLSENP